MNRTRPAWCPEDAEDWGYKILTEDRKSPVHPYRRGAPCGLFSISSHISDTWESEIRTYPQGEIVTDDSFCPCDQECCLGLHYFQELISARVFIKANFVYARSIIFNCYVPKGGKFVTRKPKVIFSDELHNLEKSRTDKLVTLEKVYS